MRQFKQAGKAKFTPEGGLAVRLINEAADPLLKGSTVQVYGAADNAVALTGANAPVSIGVAYETAPLGAECWIVVSGIADVLFQDGVAPARNDWVGISGTAGRAYTGSHPATVPPAAQAEHNTEIGHCLESKSAGTNVLAKVLLHFN